MRKWVLKMSFDSNVKRYLREYQSEYTAAIRGGQHTAELSFRVPMHRLFTNIARDLNPNGNFDVILEPKNQGKVGRPDWRIQDSISLGVFGYIEGKGPSAEAFDTTPYQNQINRYLTLGHKLIITDGIDFVFSFTDTPVVVSIIDKARLDSPDWSRLQINPQFRFYMEQFYSNPAPQRVDEEKLVELVAIRTRNLANDILEKAELTEEEALDDDERQVINLLTGLKELVYNHNDPALRTGAVFADFTAQVIMFCLLYAHRVLCTSDDTPTEKAEKIRNYAFNDIAEDEALLPFRNLMVYLRDHAGADTFIGQWVDECISFLSFVQMTEQQLMNPDYHRLFELFLVKFDEKSRFDYGAFYTPKVLANFIVRFTNEVVSEYFDGASIYDDGNTIVDPCCGTGSFLEQIIAHDSGDGAYNLCGFEILPAPYMLANYRMAIVGKQYNRQNLNTNIILANTLSNCLFGEEANSNSIEGRELARAKELSSRPLKLIIGNPPCSDSIRSNVSDDFSQIIALMDDFRPPVENRRGRQNVQKQINNPFMQFLRWSCEKLISSENHFVLAFIVPLSFLEAESYKYARKYLVEHFSHIWAVAVDTDARTGIRGDSLFHTMQGRAVILLTRKYGDDETATEVNYVDLSRERLNEKTAMLEGNIATIMASFETFEITDAMFSFMPSKPFNEELYSKFWPVSNERGKAIFLNQCSGAKMAPTALLTHVKQPMLKRRSREIASEGVPKAREWIGRQDKAVVDSKIEAFQKALNTCANRQELDSVLTENIRPCSFRPFVNSNALLWDTIFEYQSGIGGGGARIRPEIKAVYDYDNTIGFALAHAPKDLDESLGQFASFCWYFPDNDLSRRGNGHVYLNQYIPDTRTNQVVNNIDETILAYFTELCGISEAECAREVVFYAYALFCSQVYLDEFYGALFVVNQSESRARVPIVSDAGIFRRLSELGEHLANLEKNDARVDNILNLDYDGIIAQLPAGFRLEHSRAAARNPYDEEHEEFIVRDEDTGTEIRVYCPVAIQKFTVAGYNVVKDCWLKFHSYRFTHCEFTRDDFRELLDLFNKIATQMQYVSEIDEIMHGIVSEEIPLLIFNEEH
ncbi:MAG: N-6 DNA methylase [Clostridiales bacterium]|nr:N-6 DNA methylase [Clostridiales bacterium]